MSSSAEKSRRIRQKALELAFLDCGIARAGRLVEDARQLEEWLKSGFHGEMAYMANHFEKRMDPRNLVEGARSVIVVLQNYHTSAEPSDPTAPKISRYAYGRDYHKILLKKLELMMDWMRDEFGPFSGRAFVDSAPVLERAWGRLAGLGWIGKHSLLLNRRYGSWFFLGTIISDLELEPGKPVNEYCGDCTRCVDACPTGAILPGRRVDARRCISYLTIESRSKTLPGEFRGKMNNWAFGCDICQEVCPWNKNAHPHQETWLNPRPGLLDLSRADWMNLGEKEFDVLFEGSPLKRAKYSGLRRNLDFLAG
jgi:epoxyqueuosine reductase